MAAQDPKALVLAYHHAFEQRDKVAMRKLLADEGSFVGPMQSFTQADVYLERAEVYMKITKGAEIKQVIAEGNNVCLLWDYTTRVPSIPVTPIAEWFKIEAGKIKSIQGHFNAIPFAAAMERGEIEAALRAA